MDTTSNIYIFRLQTTDKTNHNLATGTTNVLMKKLGPNGFPSFSFVTGIYDKLESSGN